MVQGALSVGNAARSVQKKAVGRRAASEVALRRRLQRAKSGKAIFRKTLIQLNWLVM
jgi:hypothetical protein